MGRKHSDDNGAEVKKTAEDRDNADTKNDPADEALENVIFPEKYAERLKQGSAENIERLKTTRRKALEGIDRDLEALGRDDHGLDPGLVEQFVTLLKSARQELLNSDTLSAEQGEYLQATGKRLEALIQQVKRGLKDGSSD